MSDAIDLRKLSLRELLQLQVQLLVDIRDGLITDAATDDDRCPHPEERRVNVSGFGDLDHWICGVCRFDNKAAPMN